MQQVGIKLNTIQTMYYVSPCCFLFLCVPFTILEAPYLLHHPDALARPLMLIASAVCAFFLNVSVYMLIGNTSALTLNVAGALASSVAQIISILTLAPWRCASAATSGLHAE